MEENFEGSKVVVDLTGESKSSEYTKFLIAEGERLGTFKSFDLVELDKYGKPNEKASKIVVQVEVQEDSKPVELALFLSPLVTKAHKDSKNSNSALYDVLDNLKLLQEFSDSNGAAGGFTQSQLKTWLENTLTSKVVRVSVETTKKAKEPYSKIGKVYGFPKEDSKSDSKIVTPKDSGVVSEEKEVKTIE